MSLLHCLLTLQRRSPVRFELAVATVDPGTSGYNPRRAVPSGNLAIAHAPYYSGPHAQHARIIPRRPLIAYVESLGLRYHFLENCIMDNALKSLKGDSICAFCARMKRGALYSCCRANGYTTLVLGQHLDDLAESLFMSAFHNGVLRTMKAAYTIGKADVRVVRPLAFVRESATKAFAYAAGMPVISENCPACFEAPKERARVKKLLQREEAMHPELFAKLAAAIAPLLDARVPALLKGVAGAQRARENANRRQAPEGGDQQGGRAAGAAAENGVGENGAGSGPSLAQASNSELIAELLRRGGLGALISRRLGLPHTPPVRSAGPEV